jgi:hypothetical protein
MCENSSNPSHDSLYTCIHGNGCISQPLNNPELKFTITFFKPLYRTDPTETYSDHHPILQNEHPGYPFYRAEPTQVFERLLQLRPSTLYIFGDKSDLSNPAACEEKICRTGTGPGGSGGAALGRVKSVHMDCGHLVAMEKVKEGAKAAAEFSGLELGRWQQDQQAFEQYWRMMP